MFLADEPIRLVQWRVISKTTSSTSRVVVLRAIYGGRLLTHLRDTYITGAPHRLSTSCTALLFIYNNGPNDVDGVAASTLFGCRFIFRYVGKKNTDTFLRSITGYAASPVDPVAPANRLLFAGTGFTYDL